jgi:signal transduction histidine kinase
VTDNGCGIDEDITGRIFEAFFTTKPQGLGAGLGLYISRTQVELGGHIEVKSRPGEGSTFRITLPDVELQGGSRIH